jgi:hypothetical protein
MKMAIPYGSVKNVKNFTAGEMKAFLVEILGVVQEIIAQIAIKLKILAYLKIPLSKLD